VIVDSVYSTTGALSPLAEIVEVAEQHGCMILVDESHSLGTHGPQGAGLCAELGLTDRVHFITASLAKAFAGRAGFFTAPDELRPYMMCHSYPSIFSSCLLPHEIAGLAATLEVIRAATTRACACMRTPAPAPGLQRLGYPIHQGSEQIIALEAGAEADTWPARPAGGARRVRLGVLRAGHQPQARHGAHDAECAGLTDAEMDHVEAVAREIAPIVKPWDWPIARRARAGRSRGMRVWAAAPATPALVLHVPLAGGGDSHAL
jgi:CAI-1 autoinducer synthase